VAVCALLGFLVLVILMFQQRGGSQTAWDRLVYLLTGVEAVAFAGAGWLFGKEVHRAEAKAEQQRADNAETDARESAQQADTERTRGMQIAVAAATAAVQQPVRRVGEREVSATAGADNPMDSVADLARRLYPELFPGP
jgi:hypothetical protein